MRVRFVAKNVQLTEGIKSFAREKLEKLERHFDGVMQAQVILSSDFVSAPHQGHDRSAPSPPPDRPRGEPPGRGEEGSGDPFDKLRVAVLSTSKGGEAAEDPAGAIPDREGGQETAPDAPAAGEAPAGADTSRAGEPGAEEVATQDRAAPHGDGGTEQASDGEGSTAGFDPRDEPKPPHARAEKADGASGHCAAAEIVISVPGGAPLVATSHGESLRAAVDLAVDKMERRLRRHKEKSEKQRRGRRGR